MVMSMIDQNARATDQVLELGRHWANAERAGDAAALEPLLAHDFLLVGPLGFMLDKTQYLGSRRSADLRHESLAWEDVRVRAWDNGAVAVLSPFRARRTVAHGIWRVCWPSDSAIDMSVATS